MKIGYLMQVGVPDVRQGPFSGPSLHVRQVIAELEKLGHSVRLIANLDGRRVWKSDDLVNFEPLSLPAVDAGPFRLLERGIRRFQYELHLPYAALFDALRFAYACCRELGGYDLLYERMGWMGYGGAIAARRLGIPLVLEVNGEYLGELKLRGMSAQGLQRRLSIFVMNKSISSTSHIVAAGQALREDAIASWGARPEDVSVIQNGSLMMDLLARDQLRSFQEHASQEPPTLVFLGSFDPWQGIMKLIRVAARAIQAGIALKLLFIGDGPDRKSAEGLVDTLGIRDRVTFTGQLSPQAAAGYLTRGDIGISAYCGRSEYLGLKLFDYKAAGMGIIASGSDGEPRILEHGKTGWIVPPCDEDALYEAVVKLCTDPDLVRAMGRQARMEAERSHGWNRTAEQLSVLFSAIKRNDHVARTDNRTGNSVQPT